MNDQPMDIEETSAEDKVSAILRESEGAAMVPVVGSASAVPNAALCTLLYPWKVLLLRDEVMEARTQHSSTECNRLKGETLPRLRKGMLALFDRYSALHICAKRYLEEWPDAAPAGWSRDELEAALALELPRLPEPIDPSSWFDRQEDIEGWVVGCEPSLHAVTIQHLYAFLQGFKVVREALEAIMDVESEEQARAMLRINEMHPDPDLRRRCEIALRALLSTNRLALWPARPAAEPRA